MQPNQPCPLPEALKQFPKTVENITCCPGVKSLQVEVSWMDLVTMAMIDMNTYISQNSAKNALACFGSLFHDLFQNVS